MLRLSRSVEVCREHAQVKNAVRVKFQAGSMTDSMLTTGEQVQSIWDLGGLTWRELLYRTWGGMNKNDLLNRSYELAYNFLLAVFPLLLFLIALLGVFASAGRLRGNLFFYLEQLLPPAAYSIIVNTLREITNNS